MAYKLALFIVEVYRWLSPIKESLLLSSCGFVSHCPQRPTCSQYLIKQSCLNGWRGFARGWWRLIQCRR